MTFLSSTDLAIALADREGTLRLTKAFSRFGDAYIAIEDDHGLIEVQSSMRDAQKRLADIRKVAAA